MNTQSAPAKKTVPTPHLDLYTAVGSASQHLSDEQIIEYVKATLRDIHREDED